MRILFEGNTVPVVYEYLKVRMTVNFFLTIITTCNKIVDENRVRVFLN